ncbi:MAG: hypothetical protein ABFD89_11535 [Bryobacteraceae bacterium]
MLWMFGERASAVDAQAVFQVAAAPGTFGIYAHDFHVGNANRIKVTFNKEARRRFLDFAMSESACWRANFRDLNGAVIRMATLAPANRINVETVEEEIARLENAWRNSAPDENQELLTTILGAEKTAELDRFDSVQLAETIRICRSSRTLSEAGRRLFGVSRTHKKSPNDADRLRKYLSRFGLAWDDLQNTRTC